MMPYVSITPGAHIAVTCDLNSVDLHRIVREAATQGTGSESERRNYTPQTPQ